MKNNWAKKPFIYEINTRVWLTELSRRYQQTITLHTIPDEILDDLVAQGFDAVWLMGVWTRGEATRRSALNYIHEYRHALPDITEHDVIGSAYAIQSYAVEEVIGGREGLSGLRARLRARGIKLILDYVPNHVATDHPWIKTNPDFFVHRTPKAMRRYNGMFFPATDQYGQRYAIAHGRDPYFPSWVDTAQMNCFDPKFREASIATLIDIASQCDGVRCDMAMLMQNNIFNQTWGNFIDDPTPAVEFWEEVITSVQLMYPDCLFIAEVYWGMEYTMMMQGFDFTYDKTLYDRLFTEDLGKIRIHLEAFVAFQERNIRFIENHDEQRAASALGIEKSMMAATLICTLPGGVLLHDGQFSGRLVKLPVHISRQPDEPEKGELHEFYRQLLAETRHPIYQRGNWQLLESEHGRLLAYRWQDGDDYRLIVVNVTGQKAHDVIKLPEGNCLLRDRLNRTYSINGALDITLNGYETRIFTVERITESEAAAEAAH